MSAAHARSDSEAQALRSGFSPRALRALFGDRAGQIDFAKLQAESEVGRRQFDVYVNDRFVSRQNVELYHRPDGSIGVRVQAMALLIQDLKFDLLPQLKDRDPLELVENVGDLIPGAKTSFDVIKGRADISIPRSWFAAFGLHDGVLPPPSWTYGIPAAILNYQTNLEWNRYDAADAQHAYLSLDGRLNFNEWRLLGSGSFSADRTTGRAAADFDRGSIFLTRVFGEAKSRLKAGEIHTQAFYLDSVPLLGIELYDDETMMSSLEKGYTPVVSGIAQTSARVTVRQFGRIVFERNVRPGPFTFTDLPGLTSGTDLEVTIREETGEERTFSVPYLETPLQLRAGRVHYSASAGRWRGTSNTAGEKPFVLSGGIGYGLPWDLSIFAGAMASEDYRSATAGLAMNAGAAGAYALKLDRSRAEGQGALSDETGMRTTLQWLKRIQATGSYLSAAWRHSLSGRYLTLSEALSRRAGEALSRESQEDAARDEATLSLSQSLAGLGSWHLSGTYHRWASDRHRVNVSSIFSTYWNGMTVSLSAQHSRTTYSGGALGERETLLFANLTIPLSTLRGPGASSHYFTLGVERDSDGALRENAGLSGVFGEKQRWSYALSASRGNGSKSFNGSLSKEGRYGRATVSASHEPSADRLAFFGEGSLVGTGYGLFAAKRVNGASALIEVPNAPEAAPEQFAVATRSGARFFITDLNNYRMNEITINPNTVPANVMMPVYVRRLVPADDAVLAVSYETMKGRQFAPEITFENGEALPFGAIVRIVAPGLLSGMDTVVNERGRAYFAAAPVTGVVEAVWETRGKRHACWAPYSLVKDEALHHDASVFEKTLVCRATADGADRAEGAEGAEGAESADRADGAEGPEAAQKPEHTQSNPPPELKSGR